MPLIKSEQDLTHEEQKKIHSTVITESEIEPNIKQHLDERIANGKKLLSGASLIMSVMLIGSSIVTTMLIPAQEFYEGGEANGRALSYLTHTYFGDIFGTFYDLSTILILWFAGASAMAGLLNIVPRYLPRFGMAPDWAPRDSSAGDDFHGNRFSGDDTFSVPMLTRRAVHMRREFYC